MKKSIKITISVFAIVLIAVIGSSFILADLRTEDIKDNTQSKAQIVYAENLLKHAVSKQGLDKLKHLSTYEVVATDHWKGLMGKMGNPYTWNNDKMALRYSVGDFDGQLEVLEGDKNGFVAGIASWDYYEKTGNTYQTNVDDDAGIIFNLAAFHYFFEMADRLTKAPFIRYAGTDLLRGQEIEKVFISWGNETTKKYDHYVVWIGTDSGLIEAVAFTTRDNPKPAPGFLYGSLQFEEYTDVNGVLIPFKQSAQIGDPSDDSEDYVHRLTVYDFKWDTFPASDLRPIKVMKPVGDAKPKNE